MKAKLDESERQVARLSRDGNSLEPQVADFKLLTDAASSLKTEFASSFGRELCALDAVVGEVQDAAVAARDAVQLVEGDEESHQTVQSLEATVQSLREACQEAQRETEQETLHLKS